MRVASAVAHRLTREEFLRLAIAMPRQAGEFEILLGADRLGLAEGSSAMEALASFHSMAVREAVLSGGQVPLDIQALMDVRGLEEVHPRCPTAPCPQDLRKVTSDLVDLLRGRKLTPAEQGLVLGARASLLAPDSASRRLQRLEASLRGLVNCIDLLDPDGVAADPDLFGTVELARTVLEEEGSLTFTTYLAGLRQLGLTELSKSEAWRLYAAGVSVEEAQLVHGSARLVEVKH